MVRDGEVIVMVYEVYTILISIKNTLQCNIHEAIHFTDFNMFQPTSVIFRKHKLKEKVLK
jgi:hypothetical protein